MNEEEKQAIEYWKTHIEILHCNTQIASEYYIKVLLDLVEKQQKEIEELKTITREYEAYKIGEGNKIMIASKEWFDDGYFKENYISKDKIKEIIENHKKFLSNESSKYDEDDIENRKAIQYALARLSVLLIDILKED